MIPSHVASYSAIPSQTTLTSVIRLIAIAFVGHAGEAASQRMSVIDDINEEIDLFD